MLIFQDKYCKVIKMVARKISPKRVEKIAGISGKTQFVL
jgi:hypothetical protein